MEKLYNVIVADLKRHESKEGAEYAKRWHKYDNYRSYGMFAADMRNVFKQHKKEIQQLNCKQALDLACKLHSSHIEEQVQAGNYVLQQKIDCITPAKFSYLDKALDHFNSWSQVDDICVEGGKVIVPLLLQYPKEMLHLLRKWNKSKNMWKRRASVVPFTRKVGESGKFTKQGLELCDNLIWDKEDLVQKAVGWALKDMMRGDNQKVLAYVKKIRKAGVPSVIVLYALRDLPPHTRQQVLKIKPQKALH